MRATALISPSDYKKYGISPLATETAYTVTATVTGEGLTDEQKKVTWSEAAFKVPDSGWAEEKSVSDYVTTKTNENQITVTCEKAFGAQIEITATSVYNSEKKASFTVDYKEKIEFTGLKIDSKAVSGTITEVLNITGDRTANVEGEFSHSEAYTIKGDTVTAVVKITRSYGLTTAVTSAFASRFPEYTVTVTSDETTATISDFLDKETHKSIFLNGYPTTFTSADMETVYNALKTMGSSQEHYNIDATVTGASSNPSASPKSLGTIMLSFAEIQTWYEAFTGFNISFDHDSIVF